MVIGHRPLVYRVKHGLKSAFASVLYVTGLLKLWLRYSLKGRAVVLMYHRVLTDQDAAETWSHPGMVVSQNTFERQLRAIRRHLKTLTLCEFEAQLRSNTPFPVPSCLITFDDGWMDTYSTAWPILREQRVPAVVFLPVRFVGADQSFWQERLSRLLYQARHMAGKDESSAERVKSALRDCGLSGVLEGPNRDVRLHVMEAVQSLKREGACSAVALISVLGGLLGSEEGSGPDVFMTWEAAREMSRSGITFGAHGATHSRLTRLDPSAARAEACEARDTIERQLGVAPTAFAYPNGDWNATVARMIGSIGYRLAFATDQGTVGSSTDRLSLCRVNIHEDITATEPLLLARIAGLL